MASLFPSRVFVRAALKPARASRPARVLLLERGMPLQFFLGAHGLKFLKFGFLEVFACEIWANLRISLHARRKDLNARQLKLPFVAAPIADFDLRRPQRLRSHALYISWRTTIAVSGLLYFLGAARA